MKPTKQTQHRSQGNFGFTLTEVLVVIVIIVVLAAFSLVGIRTARRSASLAGCTEGLRIWGVAIQGYAQEHNGSVQWKNWASISNSARYYETNLGGDGVNSSATMDGKAVLATQFYRRCPEQKWNGVGNGPVGYAMSRPNPKVPSTESFNLGTASNPSELLLMIESSSILNVNGPGDIPTATDDLLTGQGQRHRHGVNVLFGDGHVSLFQISDLKNEGRLNRWFTLR